MPQQRARGTAQATVAVVGVEQRNPARLVKAHHPAGGKPFERAVKPRARVQDALARRSRGERDALQRVVRLEDAQLRRLDFQPILGPAIQS